MRKEVEELKKLNQAFTVYLDKETDNLLKDAKDMEESETSAGKMQETGLRDSEKYIRPLQKMKFTYLPIPGSDQNRESVLRKKSMANVLNFG